MKKTFLLAVLAIVVLGGGAVLAILYFTGSPAHVPGMEDAAVPAYNPAVPGVTGPTGPTGAVERQLPAKMNAPPGIPMVPQADPRAEKMEAQRMEKIESAMDAQNRRAQERIEKARKLREQGGTAAPPDPAR
jgi:hypothetical protein